MDSGGHIREPDEGDALRSGGGIVDNIIDAHRGTLPCARYTPYPVNSRSGPIRSAMSSRSRGTAGRACVCDIETTVSVFVVQSISSGQLQFASDLVVRL